MEKLKILIADDEETLRDIYEIILESVLSCEFIKAKNGEEAINCLKNNSNIDLIISDYNMPIANGASLFQYNKLNNNIPMFIFANGELQDYVDLKDFNLANKENHFISKPFDNKTLEDSFSEFIKKFKNANNINSDDFIKIKIKHFEKYSPNNIDAYLNLHERKPTKILNKDHTKTEVNDTLSKYALKNVEYIYIKKIDYHSLIIATINQLKEKLKQDHTPVEILKLAGLQFHVSLAGLESIGITSLQIELVTEIIEEVIEEVSKDELASFNLKQICDEEGFLIGHSLHIMLIAGSLCKETQLPFKSTMKKICIAAFFHDLALIEEECNYEIKLHQVEDRKLFQKIIDHPVNSAKLLPNMKEVVDDTRRIITEHHEMPNGDGYPKKLNANQIAPMSCLFILSQQITFCLLRNNFNKQRLSDFLKNNEVIFKQGNFTKFYTIAAKKFI